MAGGQRQPTAPNVPAAAMKLILPEVRRKEEGIGSRGRTGAAAAEGGDSGVHTGGREQTGKGGKGQVGGIRGQAGSRAPGRGWGKRGRQGRQWPQLQQSLRQLPPGSPPQVSAAVRAEEEREARRQQTARYEALAHMEHQRRRRQAPRFEANTIYRLGTQPGRGRSEHQGEQEGTGGGHSSQPSGGSQGGERQAGQSSGAAPVRQHLQAGRATWGGQRGKREKHRRAWERIGEEEREREAPIMGGAARVAE